MKNQYLIAIAIAVFVIVISAAGYILLNQNPNQNNINNTSTTQSNNISNSPTPTQTQQTASITPMPTQNMSDWNTYSNQQYKYSIAFPKVIKWTLLSYGDLDLISSDPINLKFRGRIVHKAPDNSNTDFTTWATAQAKAFCDVQADSCDQVVSQTDITTNSGIRGIRFYLTLNAENFGPPTKKTIGPIYIFDVHSQTNNKIRSIGLALFNYFVDQYNDTKSLYIIDQATGDAIAKSLTF